MWIMSSEFKDITSGICGLCLVKSQMIGDGFKRLLDCIYFLYLFRETCPELAFRLQDGSSSEISTCPRSRPTN